MSKLSQHPITSRLPSWVGYGLGLAAVAGAALVRWALDPLLGQTQPFPAFYVAILLVTLWLGWRPAVLAAVAGFVVGDWFFLSPRGSLGIVSLDGLAHTLVYGLVAAILIYSIDRSRRTARALAVAHEALRQKEERLRATFQKAAVGILELDSEGRLSAVNERVCQILGYHRDELLGRTVRDLTAPEDYSESDRLNAELRAGRRDCLDYEKHYLKRDGSPLWVHVTASAIRDAAGRPLRFIGTIEDISKRKRAEEALLQAKQEWEFTFDSVPDLIAIIDQEHRIRRVNRALAQRLHLRPEQCIGRSCYECIHGLPCAPGGCPHGLTAADGRTHTSEVHEGRLGGDFLVTTTPLFDNQGRIMGSVHVSRDITQRKQAEAALQGSKEELARANAELERKVRERTATLEETVAELEQFSYTITHDMRAPLRAMRGYGGILLEQCVADLTPECYEYLRRITDSAERMDRLITDALQYSGVVRQQFELEAVDAEALLRDIVEAYPQFQSPQAHIGIEGHLPMVWGNQAAMTQCFSNLLGNAVKFVRPGQTPEIRVWSERVQSPGPGGQARRPPEGKEGRAAAGAHPSVRIWFEDQGVGIEQEYQEKIWGMFQQLDKRSGGTGIGLALVRKAVERMGGRVGVESQPGQGSRFWIELQPLPSEQSCPQEFSHSE